MRQLVVLLAILASVFAEDLPASCTKQIYCDSDVLHFVQLAKLYNDSKTFVDLDLVKDENTTLAAFHVLLDETNRNPSQAQVRQFVDEYFTSHSPLDEWLPLDYSQNPSFLNTIADASLREFAKEVNDIWPILGRKIKPEVFENSNLTSLIPVTNGFIIPGGRFREIYYWDTFWIIEGLLVSGMQETSKGMIDNLIQLLKKIGHIPNGSRWYYEMRSQPPLLSAMMELYIKQTRDVEFLQANVEYLEKELEYWLETQTVDVEKDGKTYTMLRYFVASAGPRPETYLDDYNNGQRFDTDERRQEFYTDMKSAAESGWDFSTRWFIGSDGSNNGNLTDIRTRYLIPVDQNSIFARALQIVAEFQTALLKPRKAAHWSSLAKQWRKAIDHVLWNEGDGVWYDYDLLNKQHRRYFYPSNVSPLWMRALDENRIKEVGPRVVEYLRRSGGLDFPGGVPTSLSNSGEQWDFPNAWPPTVSIVVNALEVIGTKESKELAFEVAQKWVRACHIGFMDNKQMFEKYNVEEPGRYGSGGEYVVQIGFGWSNGVILEFLSRYGSVMTAKDDIPEGDEKNIIPLERKVQ